MKRVLVFGTFDGLHPGHINFLRQAKTQGDFLIVAVARNSAVRKFKNKKPHYTLRERIAYLKNISFIDEVVAGDRLQGSYKIISEKKPHIICFGYDQKKFAENLIFWLSKNNQATKTKTLKPYKPKMYHTSIMLYDSQ